MPNLPESGDPYRELASNGSMRVDGFFQQMHKNMDEKIGKEKAKLKIIEQNDRLDDGEGYFISYKHPPYIELEQVRESVVREVERIIGHIDSYNDVKWGINNIRFLVHQEVFSLLLTKEQVDLLKNLFQSGHSINEKIFITAAWLNSLITPNNAQPPARPQNTP